jgi:hypothetical protein
MSSSRDASVSAGSGGSPVSSALPPEARSPESEVVLRDALSFWERVAEIFAP